MLSEVLEKEIARLQKERERVLAELSGGGKAGPQPQGGPEQQPAGAPAPSGPTPEELQAKHGALEAKLKDIDDQIKAREAELRAAREVEKNIDDEMRKTNAMAEAMTKGGDGGHGHDHAGSVNDPVGTMIIGGIALGTIAMEAAEPIATMVEGALRRGEDATRHEAVKQTEELEALHERQKKELDGLTENEIYKEAPGKNKEAWLEHKIEQHTLEERDTLAEFEKRDPKAFELNQKEREEALHEQSKIRDEHREQLKAEKDLEAEKLREQAAHKEREPDPVQKPQWKDAERAEKQRQEIELKMLQEKQEQSRKELDERLDKKVKEGRMEPEEKEKYIEEQKKAFEKQRQEALEKLRDEQRDRADRIELLYRGPPSGRGGL